jgi:hypothetical protein
MAPPYSAPSTTRGGFLYRSLTPALLCLPLGVLAAVTFRCAVGLGFYHYPELLRAYPELRGVFPASPPFVWLLVTAVAAGGALYFLLASLVGLVRKVSALAFVRRAYLAAYALFGLYAYAVMSLTGRVEASGLESLGGADIYSVQVFFWRYDLLWLPACVVLAVAWLHVMSWRAETIRDYAGAPEEDPAQGDKVLENIRTHGRDPVYRKSTLTSLLAHLFLIVVLPWLLRLGGCVDPYRPPWGGGKPQVTTVKVVKKKPKKKRKFILNPNSKIVLHAPELDDSDLNEQVEELSRVTYVSDPNALFGQLGDGDAKTPGWQDGFKDGIVRFIRLEYRGEDWDDGMDEASAADRNFLKAFRKMSGGMKTATQSESHPIRLLKKYPKGQAPPFVYITGSHHIHVSESDIKVLRTFLQEGSLLFADAGSGHWDRSFRSMIRRVFPGNALVPIPDDDPIFQIPFAFANGAPPFWHHGGKQAMGVKFKNRWVVFYHPGDINDAWKTGHSGMDPDLARKAHEVGVNVVYYSFMRYFEETRKYRK